MRKGDDTKTEQLQIRVTARQKARLKALAAAAGTDVSRYVLSRMLPAAHERTEDLLALLAEDQDSRYVLAALNDHLAGLVGEELSEAVSSADVGSLTPLHQNYVAALVEQACHRQQLRPPEWTVRVAPLERPHFVTSMNSLRLYLLRAAPVPFKRRNIFVDTGIGGRV